MSSDASEVTQLLQAELPVASRQLTETMKQLQQTMDVAAQNLAPDSPLMYQLNQSSKDISRTFRAVEDLANVLQRQPDAILFGRTTGDSR